MGLFDTVLHGLGADAGGGIADLLNSQGGVQGLADRFGQHGLGEIAQSWISTGGNLSITPAQIQSVIGHGPIADFAQKMGISPEQAATTLAGLLPEAVDRLTPNGSLHDAGAHATGGLGGLLGGLPTK